MGSEFAGNLIADGYEVTVYDRDEKHAVPLIARGTTTAAAIADFGSCEIVLTSLPDDDALADVTLRDGGLIHALAGGAIHVSMSTVSPGLSHRLAQQHRLAGQGYVAAPVLGNPVIVAGESPPPCGCYPRRSVKRYAPATSLRHSPPRLDGIAAVAGLRSPLAIRCRVSAGPLSQSPQRCGCPRQPKESHPLAASAPRHRRAHDR
jgi:NAD binding domain of 6-phosphogluconate dehydrogenase